eukprot:maker-scaffold90_size386344-snap-gene-2.25 protein:Tk12052 transcript:maker-scaffold90_size386344-snap-gene-2.25-mRNA-1 annotation:"pancreas duodenum homeobox protein 1-like"
MDPDCTMAWLNAVVPSVPNYPASDDDSEEEVFFGPNRSQKEVNGKNARVLGRPTLYPEELARLTAAESDAGEAMRESAYGTDSLDPDDSENIPPTPGVAPRSPWSRKSNSPNKKSVSISPDKPDIFNSQDSWASPELAVTPDTPLQEVRQRTPNSARENSYDRSRSPLNQSGRMIHDESEDLVETSVHPAEEAEEKDAAADLPAIGDVMANFSPGRRQAEMSLNSSTASDWFNNTHDEHILYEKFGDNYDEVVANMTNDEKRNLKIEISEQTPKTILELLGEEILAAEMSVNKAETEPKVFDESLQIEAEPVRFPSPRISIKPPTPKPRTLTPKQKAQVVEERKEFHRRLSDGVKDFSPRMVQSAATLKLLKEDLALALSPRSFQEEEGEKQARKKLSPMGKQSNHKTPKALYPRDAIITPSPSDPLQYGTFTKRSSSSKKKPITLAHQPSDEMFKTPCLVTPQKSVSDKRRERGGFNTPSIHRTPSYLRPTSASKHRASPRKDPLTQEHGYATSHHEEVDHMACHGSRKKLPFSIDMRKIVSPVGQYIKRHPVPPLQRQIKPMIKSNQKAIEEAMEDAASHKADPERDTEGRFAALPEAVYKSSRIALEKELPEGAKWGELPKSFGKFEDVEAMVIRHVGRERVPSNLRLNSQALQGGSASPAFGGYGGGKSVLKTYERESMAPVNQSMLEMSIREVKKIHLGDIGPLY